MAKQKSWGSIKPSVGYRVNYGDPISKDLVACWLMNEGAGDFAYDIAGKNNNKGTLGGMAFPATTTSGWGIGQFGGAVNFDGTDDRITAGVAGSYAFIQNTFRYSISMWVKLTSATTRQTFMCNNAGTTTKKGFLLIFEYGVGVGTSAVRMIVSKGVANDSTDVRTPDNAITDSNWHHIVVTGDGVLSTINIYIDGVLQAPTLSDTIGAVSSGDSSQTLTIGALTGLTLPFGGKMDAIRIYNRTLVGSEVKRLYEEPFAGIETPMTGKYYVAVAGGSLIKSINGLAITSVKSLNGLAIASVKSRNGLSNV